jgi:hypothetical protein
VLSLTLDSVLGETEMARSKDREALKIYHRVYGADVCTVSVTVDLQCLYWYLVLQSGLLLLAGHCLSNAIAVASLARKTPH